MVKGANKEKVAQCIKEKANWGVLKPEHRFDHKSFSASKTKDALPNASPKLDALIDKIKELDKQDQKTHGKLFKHFIYSDVKSAYGAKLIASGLKAAGFQHAYELKKTPRGMSFGLNKFDGKSNTFATLTSVTFFEKPIGINFRKELLGAFNSRPDNTQGKNIRIIILDSGFREGIDLFDIKYVHLFEPIITKSDEKQAIGRATRFCGQRGLRFDPIAGWPLHVFRYETTVPTDIKNYLTSYDKNYNTDTFFELFLKFSNIDHKKLTFANELEQVTVQAAVDKHLTQEVHDFKVPTTSGGNSTLTKAEKMQNIVATKYAPYKWQKVKVENLCGAAPAGGAAPKVVTPLSGGATALSFTPTQEFVRRYFTPEYPHPGMLLWHSVGTGKLCTAISTLTTTFEPEDYTILYVTRYTLKGEVWKNVFDQTCSLVIQDMLKQGKTIPEAQAAKLRLLSKGWFEPMSYRQLSNLIAGKNKLADKLTELNGTKDPLYKTVIVIDEAHKLFAADVEGQEKADLDVLRNAFMHSNRTSGKDGVKLLFMTATPYTSEPMDLMRLLNLLRPADEQLPETFEEFAQVYLDEQGAFTPAGKNKYHNQIAGYISYLNREKDIRSFAYPIIKDIHVPMSKYEYLDTVEQFTAIQEKYKHAMNDLKDNKTLALQDTHNYATQLEKDLQLRLNPKREEHKQCLENLSLDVRKLKGDITTAYKAKLKECKEEADNEVKAVKAAYKDIIKEVREKLKEESKKKTKEEKEALKKKAEKEIELLKLDQTFDTEQVYINAAYLDCKNIAEEVYNKALADMPQPATKEQCDSILEYIKETEASSRIAYAEMVEDFKQNALAKLVVDEERVAQLAKEYRALNDEKELAINKDVSQQTGLEKCLAPKVKPMIDLILRGDSVLEEAEPEDPEEEIPDNVKRNIYLINGHGSEAIVKFNRRKVMPADKVLVVFPVCSRPNFMDSACTFIDIMNNPANKKLMENPIKYKKEIVKLLKRPIRIYLPGEHVPDMSTDLFLTFPKDNKVVMAKSGVFRINAVKEMDRKVVADVKSPALQLGSPLCKPVIGVINNKLAYSAKVHKEVYKGNVYPPASKIATFANMQKRSFKIENILKETGPGIYYYIGCRVAHQPATPDEYMELLKRSEEQQDLPSRKKKIVPVLPYIKGSQPMSAESQTSSASTRSSSSKRTPTPPSKESQLQNTKEEKKRLLILNKDIKDLFLTLEDVATKVPSMEAELEAMAQTNKVIYLLNELTILTNLEKHKHEATQELQVKERNNFLHFQFASIIKLNNKKYSYNFRTYGYIPTTIRAIEEKCSATNLRKKIISLYKKGKYIDLPQEPTEDKDTFLEICKKVKIL
jgi:hypothetical protein